MGKSEEEVRNRSRSGSVQTSSQVRWRPWLVIRACHIIESYNFQNGHRYYFAKFDSETKIFMPFRREIKIGWPKLRFYKCMYSPYRLVLWTLGNHINTSNQSPFIAIRQIRSRDFLQEGANLTRAQCPPTKNRELLGFCPLFFDEPTEYNFVFFNYFILF